MKVLADHGFRRGNYQKVIVTWGWTPKAQRQAKAEKIELWDFRDIIKNIVETLRGQTSHFTDDTLRTLQLYLLAKPTDAEGSG